MPLSGRDSAKVRRLISFALGLVPREDRPERIDVHEDRPVIEVEGEADADEVDIYLPANLTTRRYPRSFRYRKAAGSFRYRCWCEEVLTTVAHELRHVAQWKVPKPHRTPYYEVEAELYARFVLDAYRARRRCRHG